MLRRELAIALRSRLAWVQAALSALLVGHGFVLAIDLYSAGSRGVAGGALLGQQFDPLLGVVRPVLGSLYFAVSLLGPIAAARGISVEKERRTLGAVLLQTGAPGRLLAAKYGGALAALGLQLAAPVVLLGAWLAAGGHLAAGETAVAATGHVLYLALIAALATAAAAWTRSLAQAATATLLLVAASWAIDASEGFAALAWLGRALDWSVSAHLEALERGTLAAGAALWMVAIAAGALGLAWLGLRSDLGGMRRAALAAGVAVAGLAAAAGAGPLARSWDVSEARRNSLPATVSAELRGLPGPIALEVYLDRDDARRAQLEREVIGKLRLARPDLQVTAPLDARDAPVEGERAEGYGRVVIRVGGERRETYSSADSEVVRQLFEAAGRPVPPWDPPEYPGYPLVLEGGRRRALGALAYLGLPGGLLAAGFGLTRPRRRKA